MITALFDLGGSGARVRVRNDCAEGVLAEVLLDVHHGPGSRLSNLLHIAGTTAEVCGSRLVDRLVGGATGEWGVVQSLTEDLKELHQAYGVRKLVVADDAVTSYLGALGERAGVAVAIGTGIVGLSRAADGTMSRVDGYGAMLGDNGSGWWIGREGLFAAMAARDGRRSGSVALLEAAVERFGAVAQIPRRIVPSTRALALTASFAQDVAALARTGDPVAIRIYERAGEHIGQTLAAAARASRLEGSLTYALLGRVSDSQDLFLRTMLETVHAEGFDPIGVVPLGNALDGADRLSRASIALLSKLSPLARIARAGN